MLGEAFEVGKAASTVGLAGLSIEAHRAGGSDQRDSSLVGLSTTQKGSALGKQRLETEPNRPTETWQAIHSMLGCLFPCMLAHSSLTRGNHSYIARLLRSQRAICFTLRACKLVGTSPSIC